MADNDDRLKSPRELAAEFRANGLELDSGRLRAFWRLHELLVSRNEAGDLTRVRGWRGLVYRHYIDSALAAGFIEPRGLIMDLGTGAGFPGLPLAIMRPDWRLVLAEPRGRRLAFMEEAVGELGLANVEFYPHKVGPRFDLDIENFVTRDFEPAADSLRRAARIIPPGGRVYLMKGPSVDEELREALALPQWADFELEDDRAYDFDRGRQRRRLITWRKKETAARPVRPAGRRVVEIASRENARYKSWLKALSGRGLRKSGLAVISGAKFVREILADPSAPVAGLVVRRPDELDGFEAPPDLEVFAVRPEIFPDLDLFGAGPPLLLLQIPEIPVWDGALRPGLTVFLPFQDPANLGTALRTCAALGTRAVLLKEAANPWHPKSLRAAGPALLRADLSAGPSLAELAESPPPGLAALSPRGRDIFQAEFPPACGFLFGLEGPGLTDLWPDGRSLAIPMAPGVESLNASASLAVASAVWLARKRVAARSAADPDDGQIPGWTGCQ